MWKQISLQYNVRTRMSHDLFEHYLNKPFLFHLKTNSSVLNRNLIYEVTRVSGLVMYLQTFITEIIISIGILSVVFFFSAYDISILLAVGMFGILFIYFFRLRLIRLGEKKTSGRGKKE